jgi:hypothetical protein
VTQFDSSIANLANRQRAIQQVEDVTTALQEIWQDERQQIEDSWTYKLDDIRSLQLCCKEVDDLQLEIDGASQQIAQLKVESDDAGQTLRSLREAAALIGPRLDRLYEIHPQLEAKVAMLLDRKQEIDAQAVVLQRKRATVRDLRDEIAQLEKEVTVQSERIGTPSGDEEPPVLPRPGEPQRAAPSAHGDFPTPEDFSGAISEEEEENPEVIGPSIEFLTLTAVDSASDGSEAENGDLFIEQVMREAEEAIVMPLVRSQFAPE